MAAGVEYRLPFLHQRLVEMAINLPYAYHFRRGTNKWALKKVASRYLPQKIVYRKKVAFGLPMAPHQTASAQRQCIQSGVCADVLNLHPSGLEELIVSWRDHIPFFFSMVNLEIWGRLFILGEPIEQLSETVRGLKTAHIP
jgi:asparagine synthase (glutamine-hydrolysing)